MSQLGDIVFFADALDDIERVRIATENRRRALVDDKGLTDDDPIVLEFTGMSATFTQMEHACELQLKRAMRQHPLGEWVKGTAGVGEKQAARLLAALGDVGERPNPGKLLQYAGHGDPERSRKRKGQPVEFSPTAKMRTHLIAESCVKLIGVGNKPRSPYRDVYDREREKWSTRDTTDGHKHNHALRVVGKELLKDLWRASRGVECK